MKSDSVSQIITFDKNGLILQSCDSLFTLSDMLGKNIFKKFPVLNCVEPEIRCLSYHNKPFFVPQIPFAYKDFFGICDFVFVHHQETNEITYTWMISDNRIHNRHRTEKYQTENYQPQKNKYQPQSTVRFSAR